jgi:hypothetical protein
VNFDSRGNHSVDDAEGWRFELHDVGFAGHGRTTPETSGQTISRARP